MNEYLRERIEQATALCNHLAQANALIDVLEVPGADRNEAKELGVNAHQYLGALLCQKHFEELGKINPNDKV
jgi:hypothetical protein